LLGRSTLRFDLAEAPELRDLGHIGYDIRPSAEGHGWGRRLLSLTLEKAVEYRMEKVLLTCDSNNLASKRIIEACGGVFEKSVPILGRTYERLRYWIDLQMWEPARKYV
jgi:predicted acetyltransferase